MGRRTSELGDDLARDSACNRRVTQRAFAPLDNRPSRAILDWHGSPVASG